MSIPGGHADMPSGNMVPMTRSVRIGSGDTLKAARGSTSVAARQWQATMGSGISQSGGSEPVDVPGVPGGGMLAFQRRR